MRPSWHCYPPSPTAGCGRSHQRKILTPGTNLKRNLVVATSWHDGTVLCCHADRRGSTTFCTPCNVLVWRFRTRRRETLVLLDNAQVRRHEKSRQVTTLPQRHSRWLELVYLRAYSPELQARDHLFRVSRPWVTHNDHRSMLSTIQGVGEVRERRSRHLLGDRLGSNRTTTSQDECVQVRHDLFWIT